MTVEVKSDAGGWFSVVQMHMGTVGVLSKHRGRSTTGLFTLESKLNQSIQRLAGI